jgi:hypothetical protein
LDKDGSTPISINSFCTSVEKLCKQTKGDRNFFHLFYPPGDALKSSTYLALFAFFLFFTGFSLVFFGKITQPQPQAFFFSVILITPFLFKRLSNNLNIKAKFFI